MTRPRGFTGILRAFLAASAVLAAGATAHAYPVISPQDVVFDDGGAATGSLSLNTYGYAESGLITTTPGTALPGQSFAVPDPLAPDCVTDSSGNPWIILFNGAYDHAL